MRRKLSLAIRKELVEAVRQRYQLRNAGHEDKHPQRVRASDRISPEYMLSRFSDRVRGGNTIKRRAPGDASVTMLFSSASIDCALGDCRPDLRQTTEGGHSGLAPRPWRNTVTATRNQGTRSVAAGERRHNGSAPGRTPRTSDGDTPS